MISGAGTRTGKAGFFLLFHPGENFIFGKGSSFAVPFKIQLYFMLFRPRQELSSRSRSESRTQRATATSSDANLYQENSPSASRGDALYALNCESPENANKYNLTHKIYRSGRSLSGQAQISIRQITFVISSVKTFRNQTIHRLFRSCCTSTFRVFRIISPLS